MFKLGILGGMGPEATALFFERVVANTRAASDDEHIPSVVLNNTLIPDRTAALLDEGESPVAALQKDIDALAALGVEVIATPCNTAHAFLGQLDIPEGVRFVNMVRETLLASPEDRPLAVLGTTGLNRVGVYEKEACGTRFFLTLTDEEQALSMDAITLVKASRHAEAKKALLKAAALIRAREERAFFLLACTELSVLARDFFAVYSKDDAIDALEVLAKESVLACDYPTKEA